MFFLNKRRLPSLILSIIMCLVFVIPSTVSGEATTGTTYYVDPVSGSDTNSGTSTGAAWKTIPGTKTVDGSAMLNEAWGSITTSNKIQAGDRIVLKAGTTIDSSIAGQVLIDDTYYNDGTETDPIVIEVSPDWGTGSFTYDGTGITVVNWGLIGIRSRSYIQVKGAGSDRLFIIQNNTKEGNPSGTGLSVNSFGADWTNPDKPHSRGFYAEYIEARGNIWGIDISYHEDFTVANSTAHDNVSFGITSGGQGDRITINGNFINCTAYNNGPVEADGRHGFVQWAAQNLTYKDCVAYGNGRDGFDSGTTTNSNPSSVTYINCTSYDNGEDGFANNGCTNKGTETLDFNKATYVNCISYNNGQTGWSIYCGGTAYIYSSIAHNNGKTNYWAGNFMFYSESGSTTYVTMRNNIAYQPQKHANIYVYVTSIPTIINSDYNVYVPTSSDENVFMERYGTEYTYNNIPTTIEGVTFGAHDKFGVANDVNFASVSTTSFAGNDYHLTSGSSAINAGTLISGIYGKDKDGVDRLDPVEIGVYEFAGASHTPTTYYVDPVSGDDTNSGTSQATAWKTIPGTLKVDGSAPLNAAWGSITTSNKIQAGDRIQIKAGTTIDASIAGQVLVDDTYYNDGTEAKPIIIEVSPDWGTGNFIYDGTGITIAAWGLIGIRSRSYIQIKGAGSDRLFIIQDANGVGLSVNSRRGDWNNESLPHSKGFYAEYIEARGGTWGIDVSFHEEFIVRNATAHDNVSFGITSGSQDDRPTINGLFENCTSYNNGPVEADGRHGFVQWAATNLTYKDCVAYGNGRDGFDSGTTENSNPSSVTYINCKSYDNGEDGFANNGSVNKGDDSLDFNKATYVNCIAYNNGGCGWNIYGGGTAYIYSSIAHNNGNTPGWAGNFLFYSDNGSYTTVVMRNNIIYKPKTHSNIYIYTETIKDDQGNVTLPTYIDSDYNIYVPSGSDNEVFFEEWGNAFDYTEYADIPNEIEGVTFGAHDKIGAANDVNFTSVSTTSFAGNDYHLTSGSSAIDAGTAISSIYGKDLDGVDRSEPVEIGAYEYAEEAVQEFTIGAPEFTNFSGEAVTSLTSNSFINVDVPVSNHTLSAQTAALIIALYDGNGTMKNISYVKKSIAVNETINLGSGFKLPQEIDGCQIRVFVWDGLQTQIPLSDVVVFPDQQ